MKRKIIFILLGALLILALIFVLWFWFFGRGDKTDVLPGGSLGTGSDVTGQTGSGGQDGNGQAPIGSNTGNDSTGGNTTSPVGGSGGGSSVPTYYTYTAGSASSTYGSPSGVIWLDGSSGGVTNNRFIPTPINQLNTIDVSGIGNIGSTNKGTGGLGSAGTIFGAGIAGVLSCSAFLLSPTGALDPTAAFKVQIKDSARDSNEVMDCMTRVIAKIALQQITQSVVDWINSGFNGQPSFVQDYEQFFTDVADKAAGEFIQGSGLAFLCSPFKLQIKIAIAQSYANRKSSSASSCTLTGVVNNIEQFMNGDFSQGGWGGFLSFTTMPINNPYGAFMYGEVALNDHVIKATSEAKNNISPGGFIGSTEEYDCKTRPKLSPNGIAVGVEKYGCKTRIITPGSVIEGNLRKVMDLPIDENLLADSFDEIISALINQLMTKTLYGGLSNLSNSTDTGQQRGIDAAQTLLVNLQGASQLSQQYGTSQQGSISDIQVAQAQLTSLANCWATAASSTTLSPSQISQAQANADTANATIANLESRIALYNNNILKANAAVAMIEQLQTNALSATTLSQVQTVQGQFSAAQNSGVLISQATVTSAQQDRQTLQSEMTGLNQSTAAQITQCYAFGN